MINSVIEVVPSVFMDEIIGLAQFLKKEPEKRKIMIIITSILSIVCVGMIVLTELIWNSNDVIRGIFIILGISSVLLLLTALLSFIVVERKTVNEVIEEYSEERNRIVNKPKENISVIDIIRLNLNQLNEYYTINKIQAKSSYRISVFSISFGVILILFSVIYSIVNNEIDLIAILSISTGGIAEFIGATSLMLYKESNKNVNKFFSQLDRSQRNMLAIELTKELSEELRTKEISKIINALINNSQ